MVTLQLVCLWRLSRERDKYVWQDFHDRPWDEIIGRVYLFKAHGALNGEYYVDALADFEQALALLAKDGVNQDYYARALADKALVQCLLGQYETALATIDQALAVRRKSDAEDDYDVEDDQYDQNAMLNNRGAILVLVGAFSDALSVLSAQLNKYPKNRSLRFTLATCLLHLERYEEAVDDYEQAIAEDSSLPREGLEAARLGQQPDWDNLPPWFSASWY